MQKKLPLASVWRRSNAQVLSQEPSRQTTYPLVCDRSERIKRSLVCTSSGIRSLRPWRMGFV